MPAQWEDRPRPAHRRKDSLRARWWKRWFRRRNYRRLETELQSAQLVVWVQDQQLEQLSLKLTAAQQAEQTAYLAEKVALAKAKVAERRLAEAAEARRLAEKVAFGGRL